MKLVNLTGHELRLTDGSAILRLPSSGRARVVSESKVIRRVVLEDFKNGLPVTALSRREVVNLPPPEADTLYIVSGLVAAATPDRLDVVAPARILRDSETGRVIGCQGFAKAVEAA